MTTPRIEYATWRETYRRSGGPDGKQTSIAQSGWERDAGEIRAFSPVLVLGVLQTPAYAATVLGTSEDDPLVVNRMARQQEMITDRRRQWTLIQTEGALRWQARSATVMTEQVERLITISNTPHIHLVLIDWRTPVKAFPHTAFHLYDESAVIVATRDGTAIINDRAHLVDYRDLFNELARLASFGGAARMRYGGSLPITAHYLHSAFAEPSDTLPIIARHSTGPGLQWHYRRSSITGAPAEL